MAANPSGFNLWDMFRGGNNNPAGGNNNPPQNPPQNQPGNAPVGAGTPGNQNLADPNNPLLPAGQGGGNAGTPAEKSPLAEFSDLWQNVVPKDGQPPVVDWNDPNSIIPDIQIDPAKVVEASKRVDFSRSLDPAKVKLALSGDVAAFGEIINSTAQAAFANSAMMASRIVDNAMKKMAPRLINDALPHHMKRHSINEGFSGENPIFSNPAVAPMLENMKLQFQQKYPRASAKEITDMAKRYVLEFANAVTGKGGAGGPGGGNNLPGNAGKPQEDWIKDFLEETTTPGQQ